MAVDLEGVSNSWLTDSTFSANLAILASLISLAIGLPDLLSTAQDHRAKESAHWRSAGLWLLNLSIKKEFASDAANLQNHTSIR